MSLSIHLNFNGQCQQAFEFYVTVLQGEIDSMLQVKDAPISESFSADWQQKIVHASISIQDVVICGADVKPEQGLSQRVPKEAFAKSAGAGVIDHVRSPWAALS